MVFSDTSTKQGIIEDIDFLCGTDSTSYTLADKTRNVNRHYYEAVIDLIKASGRFEFSDPNLGAEPTHTFNLVDAQRAYSLPTNLIRLDAVEVKDTAGNWTRLQEIDIDDMHNTITDYESENGVPRYYDVRGGYISFFPAPDATQVTTTNGAKLFYVPEVDVFTAADTTQEPGIPEPYHRILSLGASYDWLLINGPESKTSSVFRDYNLLRQQLRDFASNGRNRDEAPRVRPAHKTHNYQ